MNVKQWLITLIIIAIPIVNLIFLLIWAFGKEDNRKNFSRALLILFSITIPLSIALGILGLLIENTSTNQESFEEDNKTYSVVESESNSDSQISENLEIVDMSIESNIIGNKGFNRVIGKIKNNSESTTYTGLVIEVNLYDSESSIIQSVNIVLENTLPPGEILKFNEGPIHSAAVSAKSILIRDKTIFDY